MRSTGGGHDLGAGGARFAIGDVVGDGAEEQKRFLQHQANVAAVVGDAHIADVGAVDADAAFAQVVKAADQVDQGAFARAALADQADHFAGRNVQAQAFDDRPVAIAETSLLDLNMTNHLGQGHGVDWFGHAGDMVQDFKNALGPGGGLLRVGDDAAHGVQPRIKPGAVGQKGSQHTHGHLLMRHLPNAKSPDHQQANFSDQGDGG